MYLTDNQINNIDANALRFREVELDSNSKKMQVLLSHATQLTDFALSKDNTSNDAVAPYVNKLTGCIYSSESLLCVHNRLNVLAKCGKIAKVQNGSDAIATAVHDMYWRAIDYIAKMAAEERGNARGFVFALIRKSRESGLIKIEHQHLLELRLITQGNHGDRLTRLEENHRRLEEGMRLFGQQLVKRLNALELNQLSIRDSLINLRVVV